MGSQANKQWGSKREDSPPSAISERIPDKINIGGPGVVSIIHAVQLSDHKNCEYHLYGGRGDDNNGSLIKSLLDKTSVISNNCFLIAILNKYSLIKQLVRRVALKVNFILLRTRNPVI